MIRGGGDTLFEWPKNGFNLLGMDKGEIAYEGPF